MTTKNKIDRKIRRQKRVRANIFGTKNRPRIYVFRSLKHIYVQLIDDENNKTLVAVSDLEISNLKSKDKAKKSTEKNEKKTVLAQSVGKLLAEKALKKGIKKAIFDRGCYLFHGRVKAVAEGARTGGLEF